MAATDQRERNPREGQKREPTDPRRCIDVLQGDNRETTGGPGTGKVP